MSVDDHLAARYFELALLVEPDRFGKDAVLRSLAAFGQLLLVVAGVNRNRRLDYDRTGVRAFSHEEDGASRYLHTVIDRLARSVNSGERRQERVVGIKDAVRKRLDHHRREQAHETSAYHQLDRMLAHHSQDRAIEILARGKLAMVDHL